MTQLRFDDILYRCSGCQNHFWLEELQIEETCSDCWAVIELYCSRIDKDEGEDNGNTISE